MDKTLFNQKLSDWEKVCDYFSNPSIARQLDKEEKLAIDFLINYWKSNNFNKSICEAKINYLKNCDKLHSSNREIIENSKSLRGLAQTFYAKDEALYNEFRKAMGWAPQQQTSSTPNPQNDKALMMISVEKWTKAMQYLKNERIIPMLDTNETTAIEVLGDMWRRPKYTPSMREEAAEMVKVLIASHKLHSSNRDIINHSKNLCSVARKVYENEQIFNSFKACITKYYKENRTPHRIPTPTPKPTPNPTPRKIPTPTHRDKILIIRDVVFANTLDGNIITQFGKTLYENTYYITPKLIVASDYYAQETITVDIRYSDGNVDTYDSVITFNGMGEYLLEGWGSKNGNAYSSYTYIDYAIKLGSDTIWQGRLKITPDPYQAKQPVISEITFGATDYDGNIIIDFGKPIPTGIPYLSPKITVSNYFYGVITLDMDFKYENRAPEHAETEISINGPGIYTLPGWGNSKCTSYTKDETIQFTLSTNGTVLFKTTVDIGKGSGGHKKRKISGNKRNLWNRYNDFIESIGDWFEYDSDKLSTIMIGIIFLIYVISVIGAWVHDGFIAALITGIIGFIIAGIAIYAVTLITIIVSKILRYVFYNGWTFLIVLMLFVVPNIIPAVTSLFNSYNDTTATEYAPMEDYTELYICTARVLNVREQPDKNARVIGVFSNNDYVYVYEINDGFARIKYKDGEAYVSASYIKKF